MALPTRAEIYEEHNMEYFIYEFNDKKRILNFNRQLYREVCRYANGFMVKVTNNGVEHEECLQYSVEHYFNDAYYLCTKLVLDTHPESHFINEYYHTIEGNTLDHWMVFTIVYWLLARNIAIRPQHINMMNTIIDFLLDDRYFYLFAFFTSFGRHGIEMENLNLELFPVKPSFVDTDSVFRTPIIRLGDKSNEGEKDVYEAWLQYRSIHTIKICKKILPSLIEAATVEEAKKGGNIVEKESKAKQNVIQKELPTFKYTEGTFCKSAIMTDLQLDLVLAMLIISGWMSKETNQSDFRKLFSGISSKFSLTWTGTPGELHDFFDMLTRKRKERGKLLPGYITPRGNYLNIVCSHFKNKNGDNFGNLNRQKHTDRTPNILNVIEIIINYSIEECTKKMQEIIVNHKDLLENIDFSVKPEHPSNYGKVRKSVK